MILITNNPLTNEFRKAKSSNVVPKAFCCCGLNKLFGTLNEFVCDAVVPEVDPT